MSEEHFKANRNRQVLSILKIQLPVKESHYIHIEPIAYSQNKFICK